MNIYVDFAPLDSYKIHKDVQWDELMSETSSSVCINDYSDRHVYKNHYWCQF